MSKAGIASGERNSSLALQPLSFQFGDFDSRPQLRVIEAEWKQYNSMPLLEMSLKTSHFENVIYKRYIGPSNEQFQRKNGRDGLHSKSNCLTQWRRHTDVEKIRAFKGTV
ncbi:hypothetical protein WA026_007821 [Henosepilachna vigintioctopunctata]|uniref:Uncharacterized protein n=1 Tax=Henosepilachna vigintioctopunctata TaxID=420089 RepID=A0AAW1U382_9CUCU